MYLETRKSVRKKDVYVILRIVHIEEYKYDGEERGMTYVGGAAIPEQSASKVKGTTSHPF